MHEETSRSENLLGSLWICVSSKFYLKKKKKNIYHTLEKNHILMTYVHLHLQVIMSENIQERNPILVEVCVMC